MRTLLTAAALALILGIPTALLSNPIIPYIRMIPATGLDYVFLTLTSLLTAAYLSLPAEGSCPTKTAAGGGLLGFLSFACPTCIHLLVLLVGYGFAYNVINPLRPVMGLLSVGLMLYAIGRKWEGHRAHGGRRAVSTTT